MSVELEIHDGSPNWWLSADIWTVPGDDPSGPAGLPVAGMNCFVYARVTNNGSDAVQNATVRFYWGNPSAGISRTTATVIGEANVSLNAGETQDVLCLVPWMPVFVNNGHECVVAEAFHPIEDPLPVTPDFNVPTDRHVAQRNLTVIMMMAMEKKFFSFNFEVCNSWRTARSFQVSARPGKVEELKPLLSHLGRNFPQLGKGAIEKIGFVDKPCPDENDRKQARPKVEELEVRPESCRGLSLVGELEGEAALLHIVQSADGKEVGGLSVLVVRTDKKDKEKEDE